MARYLFEFEKNTPRALVYDADRQHLVAEIEGTEVQDLMGAIRVLEHANLGHGCRGCHGRSSAQMTSRLGKQAPTIPNAALHQSVQLALLNPNNETTGTHPDALGRFPYMSGAHHGAPGLVNSVTVSPLTIPAPITGDFMAPSRPADDSIAATANPPAPKSASGRRRHLWDIDPKHHCPVIGTCLTAAQLREIVKRQSQHAEQPLSDFDIHVCVVAAASGRNALSITIQKHLNRTFSTEIRRVGALTDCASARAHWVDALARGEIPGALWAILTHPATDDELSDQIYQDVHMLSHKISAGQHAMMIRADRTDAELKRVRREFHTARMRSRHQIETHQHEIRSLTEQLDQQRVANRRLHRQVTELTRQGQSANADSDARRRLSGLERKLVNLNARLTRIQDEREHWRLACVEAEQQLRQAERDCHQAQADANALQDHLIETDGAQRRNTEPSIDLGGRRVLCVGGRHATIEQYRTLIDQRNGAFAHHDGGLEDNQNRLEAMLAAADLVICPTEFVSHDAYRRTKRFCKQHAKPHALLAKAGLGAFNRALTELARTAPV